MPQREKRNEEGKKPDMCARRKDSIGRPVYSLVPFSRAGVVTLKHQIQRKSEITTPPGRRRT
jgi:hypothetical protein